MSDYKYIFKIIVVGDTGVGKTCLVDRYCNKHFNPSHDMTIGVEFGAKTLDLKLPNQEPIKVKIQLWDTAGQESFKSITRSYYRSASGVILCYDTTRYETFLKITKWLSEIERECHQNTRIILVGMKADLIKSKVVSTEQGQKLAEEYKLLFCEVSAKTDTNVIKCFNSLVEDIFTTFKNGTPIEGVKEIGQVEKYTVIDLTNPKPEEPTNKSKCCFT